MKKLIKRAIKYGPVIYPMVRKFLNKRKNKQYTR
nr:hypothetical protein [Lentibacillus persicus]